MSDAMAPAGNATERESIKLVLRTPFAQSANNVLHQMYTSLAAPHLRHQLVPAPFSGRFGPSLRHGTCKPRGQRQLTFERQQPFGARGFSGFVFQPDCFN